MRPRARRPAEAHADATLGASDHSASPFEAARCALPGGGAWAPARGSLWRLRSPDPARKILQLRRAAAGGGASRRKCRGSLRRRGASGLAERRAAPRSGVITPASPPSRDRTPPPLATCPSVNHAPAPRRRGPPRSRHREWGEREMRARARLTRRLRAHAPPLAPLRRHVHSLPSSASAYRRAPRTRARAAAARAAAAGVSRRRPRSSRCATPRSSRRACGSSATRAGRTARLPQRDYLSSGSSLLRCLKETPS